MAGAKKKDTSPGVFDVSRPGKSAPSSSSKPIIVTNRPLLQDPMMSKDEPKAEPADQPTKQNSKITIQPITVTSSDEDSDTQLSVKTTVPTAPPADEVKQAEPAEEPKPSETALEQDAAEAPKPEEKPADAVPPSPEQPTEPPFEKPSDVPAEQPTETEDDDQAKAPATPEEEDAAAKKAQEEAAAHDAAIQKLVESEQYYLSINSVESRKTKRFILLGFVLIVLLGAVWVDVALDAGLLHIDGVKAVTHLFTN